VQTMAGCPWRRWYSPAAKWAAAIDPPEPTMIAGTELERLVASIQRTTSKEAAQARVAFK
jgi:hypothetical protein